MRDKPEPSPGGLSYSQFAEKFTIIVFEGASRLANAAGARSHTVGTGVRGLIRLYAGLPNRIFAALIVA
jgi:hypothetical protein